MLMILITLFLLLNKAIREREDHVVPLVSCLLTYNYIYINQHSLLYEVIVAFILKHHKI